MGWFFQHRETGISSRDFFRQEYGDGVQDVSVKNGAAYIAYKTPEGKVMGLVCLIKYSRDYCNFGYKPIEESMGPCESDCPKRILDQLSPVEDLYTGKMLEWSREWRKRCRANIEKQKRKAKLQPGRVYQVNQDVRFTNGLELKPGDRIVCLDAKRRVFYPESGGHFDRIRFTVRAMEMVQDIAGGMA